MTRHAAVLGSPVGHSLSPVLHRAAYEAMGLTGWTYDRVECDEADLAPFLGKLDADWAGLSLTMPLKREALRLADSVSETARTVGAANTLVPRAGGWYADNTDVAGMVDAVRAVGFSPTDGFEVAILGAGGTAQAALAAASLLGAKLVRAYVRNRSRAAELLDTGERLKTAVALVDWEELSAGLDVEMVISTVPKSAAEELADVRLRPGGVVFDVLYDPWPTWLASAAAAANCRVVSGLDLLLHQAVHQVELMTGEHPAPLDEMRTALFRAANQSRAARA